MRQRLVKILAIPAILVVAWYFVYDQQVRVEFLYGGVIGVLIYGVRWFMKRKEPGKKGETV